MQSLNQRRNILKLFGFSALPALMPFHGFAETEAKTPIYKAKDPVNFIFDGLSMSPGDYVQKLLSIHEAQAIEPDFYGNGGAVQQLEEKFAQLTGKEKAIYLPTGTMANQLAIKLLNEEHTKIIVPENSHIYRDEADAAQSVHNKRLIAVGKGKAYFNLADLQDAINYLNAGEVFKSGLGTIAIESPVRRADGRFVPLSVVKEIAAYCRVNGYRMHLDGARLHIGAAYSRVSLAEYASYFDTVYISLYKYLNAAGGAILCGEAKLIDQVSHQIKILGGTVYQNWLNAAMALHYLDGIEERWKQVAARSVNLIADLNKLDGINIKVISEGTNIYDLRLSDEIDLKALATYLYNEHNIWLGRANQEGIVKLTVNESLLTRELGEILSAWQEGLKRARE